jgi:hypothetical protein
VQKEHTEDWLQVAQALGQTTIAEGPTPTCSSLRVGEMASKKPGRATHLEVDDDKVLKSAVALQVRHSPELRQV